MPAMWWRKKTRREQLIEARDKLRRQIEILEGGPVLSRDAALDRGALIDDLSTALDEIEMDLSELKPTDA